METKFKLTFLSIPLFVCSTAFSQATWKQIASLPGNARREATSFSCGNNGYILGGETQTGTVYLKDFWKYDSKKNQWSQLADYAAAVYAPISFVIKGKMYAGMGYDRTDVRKDVWTYDTLNNKWTQLNDFPGTPRYAAAVVVLNNKAYVACGSAGGPPYLNDLWVYDPATDSWTQKSSLPDSYHPVCPTGFTLNGKLFVGLGGSPSVYNNFFEYDPYTDTWTEKSNYPHDRYAATALTTSDRIFIAGGADANNDQSDFYEYNSSNDTWISRDTLPMGVRGEGSGFVINNTLYYGAGTIDNNADGSQKDFWKYSFSTTGVTEIANKEQHLTCFNNVVSSDKTVKQFSVIDMSGRLLCKKASSQSIDLSGLSLIPGIYQVAAFYPDGTTEVLKINRE